VLNGVMMVTYFNQLRERGLSARDAVYAGGLIRLRTVLMTALLASLGLLPAALSTGIGSETQKPLAIVIIGGLISATILTLIVLPTLYLIFNRKEASKASRPRDEGEVGETYVHDRAEVINLLHQQRRERRSRYRVLRLCDAFGETTRKFRRSNHSSFSYIRLP
jgi:cobalt-zinc-cadmium resistance protein CzcA